VSKTLEHSIPRVCLQQRISVTLCIHTTRSRQTFRSILHTTDNQQFQETSCGRKSPRVHHEDPYCLNFPRIMSNSFTWSPNLNVKSHRAPNWSYKLVPLTWHMNYWASMDVQPPRHLNTLLHFSLLHQSIDTWADYEKYQNKSSIEEKKTCTRLIVIWQERLLTYKAHTGQNQSYQVQITAFYHAKKCSAGYTKNKRNVHCRLNFVVTRDNYNVLKKF